MTHNSDTKTAEPTLYIGSVLMEKNRWTADKIPTFEVSDWLSRIAGDGFSGIELWANHAARASDEELNKLISDKSLIGIFNSYVSFDDGCESEQDRDGELAIKLGARSIKYNVGSDPAKRQVYMDNLRAWRERLPEDITLLCECHPGTIIEDPGPAKAFFDESALSNHGIIVHLFSRFDSLSEWFEVFGSQILHSHLVMQDGNKRATQMDFNLPMAEDAMRILKANEYAGSYTLEFTAGIGAEDESPQLLYNNALKDLKTFQRLYRDIRTS